MDCPQALTLLNMLVSAAPQATPGDLLRLAESVVDQESDLAFVLADRALEELDDPAGIARAKEITTRTVPGWHFDIIHDEMRVNAFAEAILQVVQPGTTVLEIGSGSGLLAVLAAKAGASYVYTCESNLRVARAAQNVIHANGVSDRVSVVPAKSTELVVGEHLRERADVIIAEIFSNELIGEGALPVFEDAVARLLKPGGAVIPQRASVKAAAASCNLNRITDLADVGGVNLSPFEVLAPRVVSIAIDDADTVLTSEPQEIFDFDLASGGPFPSSVTHRDIELISMGTNSILQWISLELAPNIFLENLPGSGATSSWKALAYPTIACAKGQLNARIHAEHNRNLVRLWLE